MRSTPQDTSHEHPSHVHTHRPKPLSRTSSSLAAFVLTPLSSFSQTSQAFPQLKQSYENLVALANAREALRQTRREAVKHGKQVRKMVWRDRGEPPVELRSVEDCIEHAVRGGSRKYRFLRVLLESTSTHGIVLCFSGNLMRNLQGNQPTSRRMTISSKIQQSFIRVQTRDSRGRSYAFSGSGLQDTGPVSAHGPGTECSCRYLNEAIRISR